MIINETFVIHAMMRDDEENVRELLFLIKINLGSMEFPRCPGWPQCNPTQFGENLIGLNPVEY